VYADCVIGFAHDIEAELSRQETEEELRARFEANFAEKAVERGLMEMYNANFPGFGFVKMYQLIAK
jgi:hypothetical protein